MKDNHLLIITILFGLITHLFYINNMYIGFLSLITVFFASITIAGECLKIVLKVIYDK